MDVDILFRRKKDIHNIYILHDIEEWEKKLTPAARVDILLIGLGGYTYNYKYWSGEGNGYF